MPNVKSTRHTRWLSNSYLVYDREGGSGIIIDTGGPSSPIKDWVDQLDLTITHILNTHHHYDHIDNNTDLQCHCHAPICAHRLEINQIASDGTALEDGEILESGQLRIKVLHIPGHTNGQLAFEVEGLGVFTGDTLFKASIGGNRGPGATSFEDLHQSLMERLMQLDKSMVVYPGHMEPTTIGHEWESNPFIRCFRGLDQLDGRDCLALGQPATLKLRARDYDGGTKAWVRFYDSGQDAVVPGSRVKIVDEH